MALIIDASGEYLSRTTNLPAFSPFSVTGWIKYVTNNSEDYQGNFYHGVASPGDYDNFTLGYKNIDNAWRLWHGYDDFNTMYGVPTNGVWYYFALVSTGTYTTSYVSLQPVGSADSFAAFTAATVSGTPAKMWLGQGDPGVFQWCNARYLAWKFWDHALSTAELTAEKFYYEPQHTANVNGWYPLISDANDDSANGYNWTVNGSPTYAEDEPAGMNPLGGPVRKWLFGART